MKKVVTLVLLFVIVIGLTACNNKKEENYGLEFKNEYETLNGKLNKKGTEYRKLSIDEDNPYVKVTPDKIVEMINNKETFYLYVGDAMCPWCRSVLEKSIEVAKQYDIDKIYYIEIWDDEGNEILRDKYELQDSKVVKVSDGIDAYNSLLEAFDPVLSNYKLKDEEGNKIEVGEKRIYAPNYFYIKNGKVKKMIEGISEKQTDPMEDLTDKILEDEEKQFTEIFKTNTVCEVGGC